MALAGRGDVMEVIEPVDDPALAPPGFGISTLPMLKTRPGPSLPSTYLRVATCHILTTFLFNNIPAFSG